MQIGIFRQQIYLFRTEEGGTGDRTVLAVVASEYRWRVAHPIVVIVQAVDVVHVFPVVVEQGTEAANPPQYISRYKPKGGIDERDRTEGFGRGGGRRNLRLLQLGIGGKSFLQPIAAAREVGRRKNAILRMLSAELCQGAEGVGGNPRILVQQEYGIIPFVQGNRHAEIVGTPEAEVRSGFDEAHFGIPFLDEPDRVVLRVIVHHDDVGRIFRLPQAA